MNDDDGLTSHTDPSGNITTWVYDATGNCLGSLDQAPGTTFQWDGTASNAAEAERCPTVAPQGAARRRKPIATHTFEFRLSGSESAEQAAPIAGPLAWPSDSIVAIERVRAYLTRQGEAATSAIGGVEVHAELRQDGIFCTAQVSDFGAGDLVVVQVEIGLY
jgi:YD repeat-containing protein